MRLSDCLKCGLVVTFSPILRRSERVTGRRVGKVIFRPVGKAIERDRTPFRRAESRPKVVRKWPHTIRIVVTPAQLLFHQLCDLQERQTFWTVRKAIDSGAPVVPLSGII